MSKKFVFVGVLVVCLVGLFLPVNVGGLGENLAVVPDDWDMVSHIPYVSLDESVYYGSSGPSIKISYPGDDRQCWGPVVSANVGDVFYAGCYIKIDELPEGYSVENYAGARIGFDLRYRDGENYYCLDTLEAPVYPDTAEGVLANYVHAGDDGWNLREIDLVVPSGYYDYDLYTSQSIASCQINEVSMWLHVWSTEYGDDWNVTAWFDDIDFHLVSYGAPVLPTSAPVDGIVGEALTNGVDWIGQLFSNGPVVAGLFVVGFCVFFFKKIRDLISGD